MASPAPADGDLALTDAPDRADAASPEDAPTFENALAELEGIVEAMEDGSLSLEDSLAAYRRGAALVKVCEGALEHAKEQVRVLDGELLKPWSDATSRGSERG